MDDAGDEEKKDDDAAKSSNEDFKMVAVMGIALIALGEDVGAEMSLRTFTLLLINGDVTIRRAIPLALALLSVSDPKLEIMDTLSRLSHDSDALVVHNAIFALGIMGAGTNNARVADLLKNLAAYYRKDSSNLFVVKIAQGLLHMGKGTVSMAPLRCERSAPNHVALGSLIILMMSCVDMKLTLLDKAHYLLYYLVPAMRFV